MTQLKVKTLDGEEKSINAKDGTIMMEALRDAGLTDATCGGTASCGTCHVYFADSALAGEHTEDEGYMLESLADYVEIKDGSRLCCQLTVTEALDGAALEIAPEA